MRRIAYFGLALAGLAYPSVGTASDEAFEFWLNPSASIELDARTSVQIETAQRLRDSGDGREDTYFTRLWLNREIATNATLGGALERRINDGGADETRLIQQLSTRHGILRTRIRAEQRFVDGADRIGLRVRPRLGVAVPLFGNEQWSLNSDAELFFTLRSNNRGGQHGLTGLRTQVGVGYDVSDRLSLSLAYLRQQEFNDDGPDEIGHAPIVGIEYSF